MPPEASLDIIVDTLRNLKLRNRTCSLLIGAGCSVSAGVPSAQGIVKEIEKRYPAKFAEAPQKTYPACMAQLSIGERRDLIAEFVDKAKINWAHVCIALLIREGLVDRVLTTNFDQLVVRACALLNLFPAVYDFASSQAYSPADIPGTAVVYLHGQRTGFVLMHTKEDCEKHSRLLGPVFQDAGSGRVWIVVGYSGENDPVFDHLAAVPCFDNDLYWVGYEKSEPAPHVREKLLLDAKHAFYARGYDADSFFIELTRRLKLFPPSFVTQPLEYLSAMLDTLTEFPVQAQTGTIDVMKSARELIQRCCGLVAQPAAGAVPTGEPISAPPAPPLAAEVEALRLLLAGEYGQVLQFLPARGETLSPKLAEALSWALVTQGNRHSDDALTKSGEHADRLFALAGEKYQAALGIKPDKHEALNNWGIALSDQAKTKSGEHADHLFALAGEKYQAALGIKPDKHEALYNWGTALSHQARTKSGEQADGLYNLAMEKLILAEKLQPGVAAYNLACIAALRGDEAGAENWLLTSQRIGQLPSRQDLLNDLDLASIRKKSWFEKILASAK